MEMVNKKGRYPIRRAEVIEVIHTVVIAGTGTDENPTRSADIYWTLNGKLIGIIDPEREVRDDDKK